VKKLFNFNKWLEINEKFEYHNILSSTVWSKDLIFNSKIRDKLLAIANDFIENLKLSTKIIDIQLTGSLANYNWTASSDLDVHIIIDFSEIDENLELVRKSLDGQRFIWNQRRLVVIKGHDVECYVQHKDEQHVSSGLFSLLNNKWIVKPVWDPPTVDQKDVNEKIRVIKSEFFEIKRDILGASGEQAKILYNYLSKFKKKIMKDRKEALNKNGEFSVENLVFKELRRDGTIEDIIEIESKAYANIYNE
jgi:hypothetical protein